MIEWLDILIVVGVAILISVPILWGFWQATQLAQAMERRLDAIQAEVDDLRDARATDQEEIRELRDGISQLVEQIRRANMTPIWTPEQVKRRPRSTASTLARRISAGFTVEEMAGLAFEIGLSGDDLRGDTREERARALVTYMENRGRLSDLRRLVDEQRPSK